MRVIIIGAGIVGQTIAKRFSSEAQDVVLIEQDASKIKHAKESLDVRIIHGSGSSPQILSEAGIDKAEMVIAVTNSDEVNMVACLIADTQSRVPKKVARIRNPDYLNHTAIFDAKHLDLDLIINPEKVAAERILKIIEIPGALDVVDLLDGRLKLVGYRLTDSSPIAGKKIRELTGDYPDTVIVAIYRGAETIIPTGDTPLKADDMVFAITRHDNTDSIVRLLGNGNKKSGNKFIIVGGGDIGYGIAKPLEGHGHNVKIIEKNEARAAFLAEDLDKTLVLSGDGTDRELLKEENIADTDTIVAVTNDEEANILTALLAKRLGAKRSIALVDKPEYLSMVSTIGIDVAVSPRLATVSDILQFVRKGKILSVKALMEERIEAIETLAMETSDIVDTPLKDVKFPKGALVGAIVRDDELILPTGDTVIRPKDRLVVFALRKAIANIEKLLMVKPEFF